VRPTDASWRVLLIACLCLLACQRSPDPAGRVGARKSGAAGAPKGAASGPGSKVSPSDPCATNRRGPECKLQCRTDAECGDRSVCVRGIGQGWALCMSRCAADAECPLGQLCSCGDHNRCTAPQWDDVVGGDHCSAPLPPGLAPDGKKR
jgi:hypothetical protein